MYVERNAVLLQLNPISHLVMSWYSSFFENLSMRINMHSISFDLNVSVVFYLILGIILTIAGFIAVKRKDLIVANNETGGSE